MIIKSGVIELIGSINRTLIIIHFFPSKKLIFLIFMILCKYSLELILYDFRDNFIYTFY